MRYGDDDVGDGLVIKVGADVADKCFINFQCINGEALEIREKRITSAKIVQ
jgi:hypothetical protein